MRKLLVLSEDRALKDELQKGLAPSRYQCDELREKDRLLDQSGAVEYAVIVLDEASVGGDLDLVSLLREQRPHKVLWLSRDGHVASAAEAIRRGADFYLPLPLDSGLWQQLLGEWERHDAREPGHHALPARLAEFQEAEVVGQSEAIRRAFLLAARVAPTDSPVLITGETGVGKELVARAVHRLSNRSHKPFVAVNCGAIPETLLESELFGFRKGAFTGATMDRAGLFEQAAGGTFFLDEVGELSPAMQIKLLRVLEEDKIRPLGAGDEVRVNVRILAATNRDLAEDIAQKKFRMDLFYRLNVIAIHVPPLRERPGDIPPLIKFFLHKYNQRFGKNIISITRDALFALLHYDYPGNVRELENIIQHGVILSDGNVIEKTALPPQVFKQSQLALEGSRKERPVSLDQAEEDLIKQALTRFNGNQTETAKSLGISRSTLWRKIKAYQLENFK